MPYVFLNPDGSQDFGVVVIVQASTGVTYAHQCGGHATKTRTTEGFLIPVGGPNEATRLYEWFWGTFHGQCHGNTVAWTEQQVDELAALVRELPCWLTTPDGVDDERRLLELDRERIAACVEAWIPVKTAYGPGILLIRNSD
jgi:hypothetical protein